MRIYLHQKSFFSANQQRPGSDLLLVESPESFSNARSSGMSLMDPLKRKVGIPPTFRRELLPKTTNPQFQCNHSDRRPQVQCNLEYQQSNMQARFKTTYMIYL